MTSVVLRRAGLRISEPAAICQAPAEDLYRLAQVLRCDREDLCDRTHRYFPNAWRRGPVSFGAAVVYREDILLDRRRISPLTLQTSEHHRAAWRSEEHTSELQSLMRISYAVFCLKKKKTL